MIRQIFWRVAHSPTHDDVSLGTGLFMRVSSHVTLASRYCVEAYVIDSISSKPCSSADWIVCCHQFEKCRIDLRARCRLDGHNNTVYFSCSTTWFNVKDWPLVVLKHTQLTIDEEAEIDTMEIPELLDQVRKECPERENIIFPSGYDGMEVATMRRRVKNQLRLDLDELTELTQDGSKLGKKAKTIEYLIKIRPGLIKGT